MSVSRETLEDLAGRHGLPAAAAERLRAAPGGPGRRAGPADHPARLRRGAAGPRGRLAVGPRAAGAGLRRPDRGHRLGSGLPGPRPGGRAPGGAGGPGRVRRPQVRRDRAPRAPRRARKRPCGAGAGRGVGGRPRVRRAAERAPTRRSPPVRVGPLALLLEYAAPLLREQRRARGLEGRAGARRDRARRSAAAATLGMEVVGARPVMPFAGARNRNLHLSRKVAPTPRGFPRRSGAARKRPLA